MEQEFKWISRGSDVPKNRSIVLGSNERGDMTVLEFKHRCFYDGLLLVTNIAWWTYIPSQPPVERTRKY